ncbi:hypothetical protein V1478_016921 [Vespula squamosa]|uniref:Uncharacterized protein n=1 Tax=Vespula squamosa TaxID=30214 RepID=A0ABD1ZXX0_VESSQ
MEYNIFEEQRKFISCRNFYQSNRLTMQRLILNEFNNNEYSKYLLQERVEYCASVIEDSKCFKIENNLFVLKEFAICDKRVILVANYTFLAPLNEDRLSRKDSIGVRWLTDNHRGLEWNGGFINYNGKYNIFE